MNLSRLATLAVFFIMVMSAFVTVPTYNVGADEGGCMDYEDTNDNGLYDEGEPCYDDDDGDRPPGEGRGCMDYDDTNDNGLYDEGEPCYDDDGPDVESYFLSATMESLEDWSIEFYGEMPIDWSDDARSDIVKMCEEMLGTDGSEIDEECFEHWTEMMMSSDGGPDDCPFDRENPDSPCNAEVCRDDDGSEECEDYIEDYCADVDDPVCVIWSSCFSGSSARDCMAAFYEHCTSDASSDFCGDDFRQDDSGTWVQCWYDGTGGEACQPNWLVGLAAYESGDISAEDFMDYYMVPTFAQEDYHDDKTALYELSHITLEEGTWVIVPDYLSSPNPNFICGNGERIIFSWINDGWHDCEDGADEQWYDNNTPDDNSDDCQEWSDEDCEGEEVNWFDCHDGTKVWINQVNNNEWNCPDGEDEYFHHLWSGDLLLFKGHLAELNTDDEILAFNMNDCKWWDAEHTDYKCDDILKIELDEEQDLTLATTGRCWENWVYDDENDNYVLDETDPYICDNWGTFSHKIFSDSDLSISEQELIGFINGTVDQGSFGQIPSSSYYEDQQFVLYETEEITISEGRWNGDILTQSWECYYDWWEDDEVCDSRSTSSYLYRDNFDPQNPEENLIASNGGFDSYDSSDCNYAANCFMSRLDVSLAEGEYIIVIAAQDSYSSGMNFSTTLSNSDGHLHTFSGILDQSYWMNKESGGENIASVEVNEDGNITVYFENVLEADGYHYLAFDEYDEDDDEWNYIDDNDLNNDYNWTNFTCSYWCQDWDGESLLRITLQSNSNDSGDSTYTVAYFDPSDNSLEFVYPELIVGDERTNMPKADYECYECGDDGPDYWQHLMKNSTMYRDEEIGSLEAIDNVIIIIEMMDDAGWFNDEESDDGKVYWSGEYYYCEWEGSEDGEDTVWWCMNSTSSDSWSNWWYYCENFEGMWYCTDDFGQNPDYACSADNNHYKEGGRPDMDYCGDDDDPAILDGIVGINDPEDNEPMPMSENMIGVVSDNEGLPLMMGSSFKVHFDGVDESLETHDLYIPIGGDSDYDEKWYVDINLLSGYEVISCEGCEDLVIEGSNAKFNANEPVTVIFGSRPDCDHTVTIDGYSFEPAELIISVGDTVCWIWDTEEEHNVVEIATKFDEDMNLEDARIGFYSGDSAKKVDFRHTFTEDNKTHYYVCEPHISMSMAGAVIVGAGSEDDRIPEVIEDSGLPNISFIAGALVLVGAAGLRRRIH